MWRVINHAFLIPYYSALYSFHLMKPRNSALFVMMPDLIGIKLRIHSCKSADRSTVPNFSTDPVNLGLRQTACSLTARRWNWGEKNGCGQFRSHQWLPESLQSTGCPDLGRDIQLGNALKTSTCPKTGIGGDNVNKSSKLDWEKIRREAVEKMKEGGLSWGSSGQDLMLPVQET